jgi:AhpD family alkylhydroperoxidase
MHYHDSDDHQFTKQLRQAAPAAVEAFMAFDAAVFGSDTTLDAKTKELIAVAVAATTQCPYCIEAHAGGAKRAGATEAEVAEAVMVSSALRAGGSFTHGWLALKSYDAAE